MPRTEINVTPGYNSSGNSFLHITERVYRNERSMDFDVNEIASYTLMYLPDTNEVALVKTSDNDEILYSEEVI